MIYRGGEVRVEEPMVRVRWRDTSEGQIPRGYFVKVDCQL